MRYWKVTNPTEAHRDYRDRIGQQVSQPFPDTISLWFGENDTQYFNVTEITLVKPSSPLSPLPDEEPARPFWWVKEPAEDSPLHQLYKGFTRAKQEAIRHAHTCELAGEGDPDRKYHEIRELLLDFVAEIDVLYKHSHDWDDKGFCSICGFDGNA